MRKIWLDGVWEEYLEWQLKDKRSFKKINSLIKSIDRNGYECEGRPEALRGNLASWWSVKFTKKDRIVFRIKDGAIEILQVGTHYGDK
jgi:toxin YoeB